MSTKWTIHKNEITLPRNNGGMTKQEKIELAEKIEQVLPEFLTILNTDMDKWYASEYTTGEEMTQKLINYLRFPICFS